MSVIGKHPLPQFGGGQDGGGLKELLPNGEKIFANDTTNYTFSHNFDFDRYSKLIIEFYGRINGTIYSKINGVAQNYRTILNKNNDGSLSGTLSYNTEIPFNFTENLDAAVFFVLNVVKTNGEIQILGHSSATTSVGLVRTRVIGVFNSTPITSFQSIQFYGTQIRANSKMFFYGEKYQ